MLKVVAGFLTDDATAPKATGVWQSLEPTGHRCRALPHDERIPYWQEPTGNWQLSHMTSPVPCGAKVRHGALPDTSMSHQSIVLGGHTEWLYFSAFSKYVAAQYIMSTDKRPAIASIKSGSADRRARNLRPATASALREISANTRPPDPPSSTPDSLDFYSPFERLTSSDSGDDW